MPPGCVPDGGGKSGTIKERGKRGVPTALAVYA